MSQIPEEILIVADRIRKLHSGVRFFAHIHLKQKTELLKRLKYYAKHSSHKETTSIYSEELLPLINEILLKGIGIFDEFKSYTNLEMFEDALKLTDNNQELIADDIELQTEIEILATQSDKEKWFEEIRNEVIAYKGIFSVNHLSQPTRNNFILTQEQCRQLYYFTITGLGKNKQFIKPSPLYSEIDLFNLLTNSNRNQSNNVEFKFGCSNAYVAFILYWLQSKDYIKDAFTSISKTGCFFSAFNRLKKPITDGALSSAKSIFENNHFKFDEIINMPVNRQSKIEIDDYSTQKEIAIFLHYQLTDIFRFDRR